MTGHGKIHEGARVRKRATEEKQMQNTLITSIKRKNMLRRIEIQRKKQLILVAQNCP